MNMKIRNIVIIAVISLMQLNALAVRDGNGNYLIPSGEKLGVGVLQPLALLHVNGKLMISDGTEQAGYVLISDADGIASWATNSPALFGGRPPSDYLLSNGSDSYVSGTLTFNAGTTVDIKSTDLRIADTNITLDGSSTTFTQTTGSINMSPAPGSGFNINLSGAGDFAVNTNHLYVDTSAGNVGIGTNITSATLDLVGTFQYTDGNQAVGRLLTSDASGNATWQAPAAISIADNSLDFIKFSNTMNLDATTKINLGAYNLNIDLNSTGDLQILDAGVAQHIFHDNGSIVINEQGNAVKLRIKSNTDPDAFIFNASTGILGLGTNTEYGSFNIKNTHNAGVSRTSMGIEISDEDYWADIAFKGLTGGGEPILKWRVGATGDTRSYANGGQNKFYIYQNTNSSDATVNDYRMVIDDNGAVGINMTYPSTGVNLEVSSIIKSTPTDSPGACNVNTEGGMYYDASMKEPCFCNSTNWVQFDNGNPCY
jgi:hypothetical protein